MKFKTEKNGYDKKEVDSYIKQLTASYEDAAALSKERIFELKKELVTMEGKLKDYRDKADYVSKAIVSAVAKADDIERLTQIKYRQEMEQLKAFHDRWLSYYNRLLKKYPLTGDAEEIKRFNAEMSKILNRKGDTVIQYNKEKERLEETQIGYVSVKATGGDSASDEEILKQMLPDADSDMLASSDFDPVGRIRNFLSKEADPRPAQKPAVKREKKPQPPKSAPAPTPAAPVSDYFSENAATFDITGDYADRSDSGFSFEEALNPKEDLSDIMKDLGLLLDD